MEIYAACVFLLAGAFKRVIGLGLPTVSVGLLCLVLPPAQAAAWLVVPSLATNLWQMAVGGHLRAVLRRFWPMMLGIAAGTWSARWACIDLRTGGDAWAAAALGLVLALYGGLGIAAVPFRLPPRAEPFLSPLAGLATGLATAATGSFVIPSVPYLQALGLGRDLLVQALGLCFTVATLALAASPAGDGTLARLAGPSALALVPAVLGMVLGRALRRRVRAQTFRRCFFLALIALGAQLALK